MEGFCRGCLNRFDDPNDLLQYTEERRRLYVYSTGLQVKRNDAFTFQICKECYFSMKTSCKFKKMCRTSDKKIKSYIALKDVDDDLDFGAFLKRNDDSITFRLPTLSGSSTPIHQEAKDDDAESTSTSIKNFMRDMLRAEEIPDTEARIIREVIEEEADVLEDSLDSHWLQDDTSMDVEFPLDVSFSQFSTPYSSNKERMLSPDHRGLTVTSTDVTSGEDYDNIPIDSKVSDLVDSSQVLQNVQSICVHNKTSNVRCVIDKNLERALKNENNREIPLEELLASPSGASTPIIKHILFGDKANDSIKTKSPNFDADLDLLMGKIDKGKSSGSKLYSGKFDVGSGNVFTNIIPEGKLNLDKLITKNEKKHKEAFDLNRTNTENSIEGNLDFGKLNIEKFKRGNKDMGKLRSSKLKQGNLSVGNIKSGKSYEETLEFENLILGKTQEEKIVLKNTCAGKLDLENLSIEVLLKDESNTDKMDTGKLLNGNIDPIKIYVEGSQYIKGGKVCADNLQEVESDHVILAEFLNTEKGMLNNDEDTHNGIQIDDAELTELLQDACDQNVGLNKTKKLLKIQNSINPVILSNDDESKPNTNTISPMTREYCITNFYCKMCSKKFENLSALKTHFTRFHQCKIITPKKPRKIQIKVCDICGRSFTNTKSLVKHLANHENPKEFTCEICTLNFTSANALNTHKSTHMKIKIKNKPKEPNPKYICNICGAISSSSSNHLTHVRRHSKSYTVHCEECGSGFYRRSEMILHMRKHTKEKPFQCAFCDKRFSRRDVLNKHMKLHLEERPYSCQYCGQKFTESYEVKPHQMKNKNCLKRQEKMLIKATEI